MAGDSAHDGGIFIVDLALNQAMAEGAVIFCGRDCGLQVGWRVEAGVRKIEFGEDFTLAELVQRLAGKLFQRLAQQDEANVTVFGARAGLGGKRDAERMVEQFVLIMGGLKELDIGRQAGGVRQKHAERDLAAGIFLSRAAFGEFRQQFDQWLVEFEQAAIIQDHAGGGCGNDLRDRSEIVDGFGGHGRRRGVISEMPEALVRDQLALCAMATAAPGKARCCDAGAKNVERHAEIVRPDARMTGTACCWYFGAENLLVLLLFSVYNTLSSQMTFPRKAIGLISILILSVQGFRLRVLLRRKKKKPAAESKETANFSPVDLLVQEQINDQVITGAVLVVGHGGKIVHQKAFGLRATSPRR